MKNPIHVVRAIRSGLILARDPDRLDQVWALFDAAAKAMRGTELAQAIIDGLREDPRGASAFAERPRLEIDLAYLRTLPSGTLGRAFAAHMDHLGLDPAAIPRLEANDEFAYSMAYLYDTHDVWHAVTGFETDVAGELGLQAFYFAQFPARFADFLLLGGFVNTLFLNFEDRDRRMNAIARGWLLGKRSAALFGVRWADLWTTPLDDVRALLDLDLPAIDSQLPQLRNAEARDRGNGVDHEIKKLLPTKWMPANILEKFLNDRNGEHKRISA